MQMRLAGSLKIFLPALLLLVAAPAMVMAVKGDGGSSSSNDSSVLPYTLVDKWRYYLEADRSNPWPDCGFRFLSYVGSDSSSLVNLWNGAGVNQQFEVVWVENTKSTLQLRVPGEERYLAVSHSDCNAADVSVILAANASSADARWTMTPASDQPGHFSITSVSRATCAGTSRLGYGSVCNPNGPDSVKLGSDGSWYFAPAQAAATYELPASTPSHLCADPFAWFSNDTSDFRLVCTGADLPLFKAAHLDTETVFDRVGFALNASEHFPDWLASGARWAPENMWKAFGLNFAILSDQQPAGMHRVGYVTSAAGPTPSSYKSVSKTYLTLSPGDSGDIDAHLFLDPAATSGQLANTTYLVWKSDDNRVGWDYTRIWIQQVDLTAAGTVNQLSPVEVIMNSTGLWWAVSFISGGSLTEGPEMLYRNGYYYLFFAAGRYNDASYSEGVARSRSPRGPFEKMRVPLVSTGLIGVGNDGKKLQGPGHGAIVQDIVGGRYFFVFHAHTETSPVLNRRAYIMEMVFVNDWPMLKVVTRRSEARE